MPKFEKRFVHFMWDDELEGKNGFFSDDVMFLKSYVEQDCLEHYCVCRKANNSNRPFNVKGDVYRFVYYDPYYELKLAHEQGKVIQFHELNDDWDEWLDCENEPDWGYPPERYRIKPEPEPESKHVTNLELAKWLAQAYT